jgi:hypothetical protein
MKRTGESQDFVKAMNLVTQAFLHIWQGVSTKKLLIYD